ncbi:hypothetical protein BCR32DRAFT_326253 [Anaeromyces robustus]|uniref:Uncharacterized protein n=1 Tax=Anaeromyces robustus TaxID=1754192 RepID=A0A1Y1XEE1_9FUNG|nr:hypothetical protein BCR32DRAFT_326253 [Anaeromyces robustus]|eukprot:ORX83744.1 hypothetical protein BCR32DRAFT_326253 [Anaeromyces robustus]
MSTTSDDTFPNEKRRSLTFADKFEVKFFFKAEAPREVAYSETSFTTGSESYYDDDEYWYQEDSYDDEEEEDYYDDDYYEYDDYDEQDYDNYLPQRNYHHYTTAEYDDYYHYDYNYYNNGVNLSIQYSMNESDDSEEEIRGRRRELFGSFRGGEVEVEEEDDDVQNANERSTTRRLALAKLEKGLFRRQQLRDSESFSETEESEVSVSNSETDPFDEPLPSLPSLSSLPSLPSKSKTDFLSVDLKRSNSPVTIKATFTTRDLPISIPISNHNAYKVKNNLPILNEFSERFKPSSLSLLDIEDNNPLSSLDDTLLSCTPLSMINKSPLVVNLSTSPKDHVKDMLKKSLFSNPATPIGNKTKSLDLKCVTTLNSKDLVKSLTSNKLSNNKSSNTTNNHPKLSNLLSNIHNNTNSRGVNNKGVKKRSRSYSSPSSLQQLLPCY